MQLIKKVTSYPTTLEAMLRANLRIPDGMDTELVQLHLTAAIDYVEDQCGISITKKTVVQEYTLPLTKYKLKFLPETIDEVVVNDEDVTDQVTYSEDVQPGYIFFSEVYYNPDVNKIRISYSCKAMDMPPALQVLVLSIASQFYNNPEGLPSPDIKRINMLLNQFAI